MAVTAAVAATAVAVAVAGSRHGLPPLSDTRPNSLILTDEADRTLSRARTSRGSVAALSMAAGGPS